MLRGTQRTSGINGTWGMTSSGTYVGTPPIVSRLGSVTMTRIIVIQCNGVGNESGGWAFLDGAGFTRGWSLGYAGTNQITPSSYIVDGAGVPVVLGSSVPLPIGRMQVVVMTLVANVATLYTNGVLVGTALVGGMTPAINTDLYGIVSPTASSKVAFFMLAATDLNALDAIQVRNVTNQIIDTFEQDRRFTSLGLGADELIYDGRKTYPGNFFTATIGAGSEMAATGPNIQPFFADVRF